MGTNSLQKRVDDLYADIRGYTIAPPRRGTNDDRVSGTADPRRLPTSETLLQIVIDLDAIADRIARGRGDELIDGAVALPAGDLMALIPALRDRGARCARAARILGATTSTIHYIRTLALDDRGDVSDGFISSLIRELELRLADWVRGHDPEDETSTLGSEW